MSTHHRRPKTLSLTSRPSISSLPIIPLLTDTEEYDTSSGSISFHAAALLLEDNASGASVRDWEGCGSASVSGEERRKSSGSSLPTVHSEQTSPSLYFPSNEVHPPEEANPPSRKPFPTTSPLQDRTSPEMDNIFEPPQLLPLMDRSRTSSTYSFSSSLSGTFGRPGPGHGQGVGVTPLPSPTREGLPKTGGEGEGEGYTSGLPSSFERKTGYGDNAGLSRDPGEPMPVSDSPEVDMEGPPRPTPATPTKSRSLDTHNLNFPNLSPSRTHVLSPTLVASPEEGAPPSNVTLSDLLQQLKRQPSVSPLPGTGRSVSVGVDIRQYATFCVLLWWRTLAAVGHSLGNPRHVWDVLTVAALSTLFPLLQYLARLVEETWTLLRIKYRFPPLSDLLKLKHETSYTLFDCFSPSQLSAGKEALSTLPLPAHSHSQFSLPAARVLLQLCALLACRQPRPGTGDRFAKHGEGYVRLAARAFGLEYVPVSALNTRGEGCCAAFYDMNSNWIVLVFHAEWKSMVDELLWTSQSPSVQLSQIHGFGKVRTCFSDRLFPTSTPSARLPYHTILQSVRILSSQLPAAHVQLYFTGHGAGGAVAALAMAAVLDIEQREREWGVQVGDGYVFGSPSVCDTLSARAFDQKLAKSWERPCRLWRVVNETDSLVHKSWNLDPQTQEYLGTSVLLSHTNPLPLLPVLPSHPAPAPTSSLPTPNSLPTPLPTPSPPAARPDPQRPERTLMDTHSRVRRLFRDWPVLRGVVAHEMGEYWELLNLPGQGRGGEGGYDNLLVGY
ncbi:hypothetical protein DACRYDRAFT_119237 [Dacryopinax primogenitus]|uniref:Fungal lipase-type domain-containing protein n=1 Tax=Dacryopinax primogenitus (strain DJM 731) TaxID=1858805 RepID=M5FRE7_DACPD|nr:uncharacterized protein DACRYDRAFT_119237 [Dacryopinax primogenitus]EJT97554.1 hypothetical protein DACRYDRAFT_119237 [Dacryopinax primogenitus]